jgi:hypothetical protein
MWLHGATHATGAPMQHQQEACRGLFLHALTLTLPKHAVPTSWKATDAPHAFHAHLAVAQPAALRTLLRCRVPQACSSMPQSAHVSMHVQARRSERLCMPRAGLSASKSAPLWQAVRASRSDLQVDRLPWHCAAGHHGQHGGACSTTLFYALAHLKQQPDMSC